MRLRLIWVCVARAIVSGSQSLAEIDKNIYFLKSMKFKIIFRWGFQSFINEKIIISQNNFVETVNFKR